MVPKSPLSPLSPLGPIGPCGPRGPGLPLKPLSPSLPLSPLRPRGPASPLGPMSPFSPLGPTGPLSPFSPCRPGLPGLPGFPTGPAGPGGPGSPRGPGGPDGPATTAPMGADRDLPDGGRGFVRGLLGLGVVGFLVVVVVVVGFCVGTSPSPAPPPLPSTSLLEVSSWRRFRENSASLQTGQQPSVRTCSSAGHGSSGQGVRWQSRMPPLHRQVWHGKSWLRTSSPCWISLLRCLHGAWADATAAAAARRPQSKGTQDWRWPGIASTGAEKGKG